MKAMISLNGLFDYIQSLSLSTQNMRWLGNKLIEMAEQKDKEKKIIYPRISQDWKVSKEVLNMAIGPLPKDIDWETETDKMWEEMAQ